MALLKAGASSRPKPSSTKLRVPRPASTERREALQAASSWAWKRSRPDCWRGEGSSLRNARGAILQAGCVVGLCSAAERNPTVHPVEPFAERVGCLLEALGNFGSVGLLPTGLHRHGLGAHRGDSASDRVRSFLQLRDLQLRLEAFLTIARGKLDTRILFHLESLLYRIARRRDFDDVPAWTHQRTMRGAEKEQPRCAFSGRIQRWSV